MKSLPMLFVAACLAACQSSAVIESFDQRSGLTFVAGVQPAVFARVEGQFSRTARDYLYLGPVEVNERGLREYYLWVGVASTIDKAFLASADSGGDRLIVIADGVPYEFGLLPWSERVPRLADQRVYDPAVAPGQVLAARVTRDQLALISGGNIERVQLSHEQQPAEEYFLWNDEADWAEFNQYAGIR